jgi:hypothetical protein
MDRRVIKSDKMKNNSKKIYSLGFVLASGWLEAQEPFTDDVQDVPIDNWLLPLFVIGTLIVLFKLRKTENKIYYIKKPIKSQTK